MAINSYSKTPASNTTVGTVNTTGSAQPSELSDAIQEIMADLAEMNDGTATLTSPSISGNLTVGGTVDGRDVAADGSKLDGIESGATADQTAAEILTAIKTVDGAGSGLDADLLDGISSASFLRSDADDTTTGLLTFAKGSTGPLAARTGYSDFLGYNASYGSYIGGGANNTANRYLYAGGYINAGGTVYSLWHAGNDGSGSGLDADTVDGQHASAFLTGNQTITLSGDVSGSGTTSIAVTVADDSHNHIISNVDGLQTALDGKSSTSHNHTLDGLSNTTITSNTSGEILKWNGSAWVNNTLAEAGIQPSGSYLTGNQTITLSGDASGSGTTSIVVTVADDSHNHIISNVDGLQNALDAKLASSSYTAADVLTKIKTVDGSGSGLDADLLDGIDSTSFLRSNASATNSVDLRAPIFKDSNNTAYFVDPASASHIYNLTVGTSGDNQAYPGIIISGDTGYNYNFGNGTWSSSITAGFLANCSDQWEFAVHDANNRVVSPFLFDGGSNHRLLMGRDIGWGTMYIEAAQNFRAPIFYDSNNTAKYVDPAGTSNISSLTGDGLLTFTGGSKISIQNGTDGGNSRGIFMWTSSDPNWGIYMSQAGTGKSLSGGYAASSLSGRTAHHIRFRVANTTTAGFLWENSSEAAVMSLAADTGLLNTKALYSSTSSVVVGSICGSNNGHFFSAQSNTGTPGFEIYQQHGASTRASFQVNDNRTGSKTASFLVRGDGVTSINSGGPNASTALYVRKQSNTASDSVIDIVKQLNSSANTNYLVRAWHNNGATASGSIRCNGASSMAFFAYSDERLKENIVDLPPQLDKIMALRPREFDYKDWPADDDPHQIGFVAQEMLPIYPDCVSEDEEDGMLSIGGWDKTSARIVKALQEAVQKIESLETHIEALTSRIETLENNNNLSS